MVQIRRIPVLAVVCVMLPALALAQENPRVQTLSAQDLKRLTIEELAEIDVTSVSRRIERLSEVAAAISVIHSEDIRRSGYTTLADVMRLADGVDAARVNSSTWGVSARGFNTNPANKLLVLVDGRSVYSALTSGTFWDAQDLVLSDVERIEVIRGPGGAVWGANAVNGVINVIMKEAASTRGTLVGLATGTDEHAIGVVRHGGRLGASGSYRVYGKYRRRGAQVFATGVDADDELQMGQGGFRLESGSQAAARWFVQGDLYRGRQGFQDRGDGETAGGNILGRWSRRFSSTSEFQGQASYDRTHREVPLQFEETRDTFDLDLQHNAVVAGRHNLIGGAEVRVTRGTDIGRAAFFFDPEVRTSPLVSFFAQDEIAITPRTHLILGSKFERNDFTGFEIQPTVRARWSTGQQTVWGAVSRAVRLPTRFDTDLRIINLQSRALTITGDKDFEAEEVIAYEAGYRVRPVPRLALDLAAFANRYDDLRSTEFNPATRVVVLRNRLNAVTSGIELAGTVQAHDRWRLHGSYAYLHKDLTFDQGSTDVFAGTVEGNDPSHIIAMRSYIDLPAGFAFDVIFKHTSARPAPVVDAYGELNLRLGWTVRAGWDLSLVGQNLLDEYHPELINAGASAAFAFRRGVYLRSAWRF
jgi:iron complex outermembrane receptor protein